MSAFIDGLTRDRATPTSTAHGVAVLIPGFTGSKEDFAPVTPYLAALGWDVVAYSQRGQYDSAAPEGIENYRLEDFASDAVALAAQYGRVHLLGHSFGGLVARAAVIEAPSQFASLTMLCSGPGAQSDRTDVSERIVRAGGTMGLWSDWNPNGVQSESDVFFRDRAAASSADGVISIDRILRTAADTTAELKATGVPVLVAHGDADDAWPLADQRDMAERLGAEYAIIPRAGHQPNLDNPTDTADLLSRFWTTTNPRRS